MTIYNPIYFANSGFSNSSSQPDEEVNEVCIANISPLERQKRMRFGVRQFITTLVVLAILIVLGVNHLWRLPLLFMFWAAATGYFQAHDKTWVSLASRGTRKIGENEEMIEDDVELQQVRHQARWVIFKAFLVALPLTLIAFILP